MKPFFLIAMLFLLAACGGNSGEDPASAVPGHLPLQSPVPAGCRVHTTYLPVYSDIFHMSGERRFLLTVTASIRNTNAGDTLYVLSADYYGSNGKVLRRYLDAPAYILPYSSDEFVVEHQEDEGGAGAFFLIRWALPEDAFAPVIQAAMIGTASQQGISFLTDGILLDPKKDTCTRSVQVP